MNLKLNCLLNEDAGFTRCRELAEKEFIETGENLELVDQDLRSILLIWWLSMEFVGGGIEMYLRGICADHHHEILELLKEIGADQLWGILRSADGLFDERTVPANRITRNREMDEAFEDATINTWDRLRESIDLQYENSMEESPGILLIRYLSKVNGI